MDSINFGSGWLCWKIIFSYDTGEYIYDSWEHKDYLTHDSCIRAQAIISARRGKLVWIKHPDPSRGYCNGNYTSLTESEELAFSHKILEKA